ncbi:ATP-binding protein [Kitasatospora sp. NPDC056651]|uniref:ATP-binding protein n=1 Tax=Kitasatospora sp. NPDC056651 TaxID=3345892 RepID=UPI0036BB54EC
MSLPTVGNRLGCEVCIASRQSGVKGRNVRVLSLLWAPGGWCDLISLGEPQGTAESPETGGGIAAFEVRLTRHRRSAGVARLHLRIFLARVPGGDALADDAMVVLDELVSNAVRHARVPKGRRIFVRFEMVPDHLRLEVHDASSEKPVIRRSVGVDSKSGRGLFLVEALSVEWGFMPRPEGIGKIVWALVGPRGGVS